MSRNIGDFLWRCQCSRFLAQDYRSKAETTEDVPKEARDKKPCRRKQEQKTFKEVCLPQEEVVPAGGKSNEPQEDRNNGFKDHPDGTLEQYGGPVIEHERKDVEAFSKLEGCPHRSHRFCPGDTRGRDRGEAYGRCDL